MPTGGESGGGLESIAARLVFPFGAARLCTLTVIRRDGTRGESGKLLALPYSESAPFPLPELFCLAHIGTVDGRKCVIYRVNEKNSPIL